MLCSQRGGSVIEMCESFLKLMGPAGQAMLQISNHLVAYGAFEVFSGTRLTPGQVVGAEVKRVVGGYRKYPFERLGFDFHLFKQGLFPFGSTVGPIPIPIIHRCSAFPPGNAPVRDFMKGAGEIAVGENDAVMGMALACRQVDGFFVAPLEDGLEWCTEQGVEDNDELLGLVARLGWHGVRSGEDPGLFQSEFFT